MTESAIPAAIAELRQKYDQEDEKRRKAEAAMAQYAAAIALLSGLETPIEPVAFDGTLADACRIVLKNSTKPLSPTDVRDGIVALGYDLTGKTNPMASIHSVLNRLFNSENVAKLTDHDGNTVFLWKGNADKKRALFDYSSGLQQQIARLIGDGGFAKANNELGRALQNIPNLVDPTTAKTFAEAARALGDRMNVDKTGMTQALESLTKNMGKISDTALGKKREPR